MKILLVINKYEREISTMRAIAGRIGDMGGSSEVRIFDIHDSGFFFQALDYEPNVILTFPFTAIPLSEYFYILKYLLDCHILCYRTEGAISFASRSQLKWLAGMDKYGPNLVDHEFFWGPRTADLVSGELVRQNKISGNDRIHVVGFVPYERDFRSGDEHPVPARFDDILARMDSYPKNRVFLFITGFHLADYSAQDLVNAGDCFDPAAPDAQVELNMALNGVEKAKQFRRGWIEAIEKAAQNHPDCLVVVKCHPIEFIIHERNGFDPYDVWLRHDNILYLKDGLDVGGLMPRCGLFFHYGSTCLAESYLLKTPSVFVTSRNIYGDDGRQEPSVYSYSDLGWPSSCRVDIEDISDFITNHCNSEIKFDLTPAMEVVLFDVFNIDQDCLTHKKRYAPSEVIARLILGVGQCAALAVDTDDGFLQAALSKQGRKFMNDSARRIHAAIQAHDMDLAEKNLKYLRCLANASKQCVPGVFYDAANAYWRHGAHEKAMEWTRAELDVNPGHGPSLVLLNKIGYRSSAGNTFEFDASSNGHADMHPEVFSLETTLACNLRCPECAIGGGMIERKKGFLPFEKFKIVADKIRPFAKLFFLHIWGEPMLNKEIIPMVRYASQFCRTNISTNANMLTPEKAEALITSGVAEIIVSIDGVTQEVYQQYRVGGDVSKAFAGLEMLNRLNREHRAGVHILPQFIVFRHNQHEMRAFKERCAVLGLTPFFKAPYMRTKDSPFAYSDIPQLRRPHYPDLPALKEAMRDCPNPRNVFTMLIDGSVVACCHDYSKATNFGNIFEQDVMEIWNSPAFTAFRRNVRNGDTPAFCLDYCMSYLLDPSAASADRKRGAVVAPPLVPQARPARVLEKRVNLCSGSRPLGGYINVDLLPGADVRLDLEQELLPFENDSIDVLVCMSAINYFSRDRALEIVRDVHRVLKPGGVARFGTQDLKLLAEKYLDRDEGFYFERLSDGRDRFPGKTFADKLNEFFYGFRAGDKHCRYVYDFESLGEVFHEAGFSLVERMPYQQSRLADVTAIDNRPEQMFFLEAVKTSEVVVDLEPLATSALPPGQTSRMSESLAGLHKSLRRAVVASGSARASHRSVGPTAARSRAAPAQTASLRDQALALWRRGEAQTAWQWLCRAFEAAPGDRALLETLEQVLRRQERWADLTKLYESYLAANPGDTEAQAARRVLPPVPPTLATQNQRAAAQRADLARLPIGTNTPRSDRAHLDAAIAWLLTAQKANSGGGVSAMRYLAAERWDVDYPETTGYIIPTLLAYARLSGRDEIREAAIRMGDWEVAIQSPEGGVGEPLGVFGQRPRVFNTGQVILGWVALYRETGREDYLTAARRAANWILANLESDGRWVANTYCGPRAYKSRVSWALLELQAVTGESRYGEAARRSLAWILSQSLDTGWFRNNSLSEPERPWTHLVGYVLVGLLEARRLDADGAGGEKTLHLLHTAARGLMAHYQLSKDAAGDRFATLAGTFDSGWQSRDDWSCVTGTAQIEFFLRRLSAYIDDSRLVESADALLLDLKRIQLIDGIHDPCVLGGLPGSVPLDGPYCGWAIPNWGVKFFADSLLQRLLPPDQRDCLG